MFVTALVSGVLSINELSVAVGVFVATVTLFAPTVQVTPLALTVTLQVVNAVAGVTPVMAVAV